MSAYEEYGLNITNGQFKKILTAGKRDRSVTIRILEKNLHGDHKLLLTKTQIIKLSRATSSLDLTLSRPRTKNIYRMFVKLQNEHEIKTGG